MLAATCAPEALIERALRLARIGVEGGQGAGWPPVRAIELFVPLDEGADLDALLKPLESAIGAQGAPLRLTLNAVAPDGALSHRTFVYSAQGLRAEPDDLGVHPETARRIDLDRLDHFELERIAARATASTASTGAAARCPRDERIFVLADVRSRSPDDGREAALHLPAFEHAFYEATRALRTILGERDPRAPAAVEPHRARSWRRPSTSNPRRGAAARAAPRARDAPPRHREGGGAAVAARSRRAGAAAAQPSRS